MIRKTSGFSSFMYGISPNDRYNYNKRLLKRISQLIREESRVMVLGRNSTISKN